MMDSTLADFIRAHRHDDVRQLMLQASRWPDIDVRQAAVQISAWQTARAKLPLWADTDGILFPPHLSMEQCSSQLTADYKATIARRLVPAATALTDLTGGFGVDATLLARALPAARLTFVERSEELCRLARHNLPLLGVPEADVRCDESEHVLPSLPPQSLIFADPARRDDAGGKVVSLADCTPNVVPLLDTLLAAADVVMLKLSPMLDGHKAVVDIGSVSELHIVSAANECKELLLVLSKSYAGELHVYCVNDGAVFDYTETACPDVVPVAPEVTAGAYLYEPNASIMKAGCFSRLCETYHVRALGNNSHLFVSPDKIDGFPGRGFHVNAVSTMNKKELKQLLAGLTHANIAVRNFPLTVAQLRKKLKLKDGGSTYLFATTDAQGRHLVLRTKKRKNGSL